MNDLLSLTVTGTVTAKLAPDGKPPRCPALEAKGLKLAKSLKPLPGMPAAHIFE